MSSGQIDDRIMYNEIMRRLDHLALRSLEITEDILSERLALDQEMKEAFINMAKTRYNMGNWTVGVNQLPTRDSKVEPLYRVEDVDDGNSIEYSLVVSKSEEKFCVNENPLRQRKFLSTVSQVGVDFIDNRENGSFQGEPLDNYKSGESSTDSRTFPVEEDDVDVGFNDGKIRQFPISRKNPLNWFGVLVPGSLRQSQEGFQRALAHLCRIATMQSQLTSVQTEFDKLMKQKHEVKWPQSD